MVIRKRRPHLIDSSGEEDLFYKLHVFEKEAPFSPFILSKTLLAVRVSFDGQCSIWRAGCLDHVILLVCPKQDY